MQATSQLGQLLAGSRRKRGLSLRKVAQRARTSASHLSRLESGERAGISRDLLGRLVEVLEIEAADLFTAARQLPPEVERDLADPQLGAAVVGDHRLPAETRAALRRIHIASLVPRLFPDNPSQMDDLLDLLGYQIQINSDENISVAIEERTVIVRCSSDQAETARFLGAHALGHIALEEHPACKFRRVAPEEFEATTFAAFLLAPPDRLRDVILSQAGKMDVWHRGMTGNLIETAAVRLGAPSWLVARRVCEDRLLAELAEVGEL